MTQVGLSRLALIRCRFPSYENATDPPLNSGRLGGSPQRLRASSQDPPPRQKPKKPKKQKTPDSFPVREVFRRDTAPLWPRGHCSVLEKAPEIKIVGGGPPGAGGGGLAAGHLPGAWGLRGDPSPRRGTDGRSELCRCGAREPQGDPPGAEPRRGRGQLGDPGGRGLTGKAKRTPRAPQGRWGGHFGVWGQSASGAASQRPGHRSGPLPARPPPPGPGLIRVFSYELICILIQS